MIDGVLVVDKPRGVTSFDVVRQVRRLFGQKKVGHAGTLDPSVAGVLVVALGKATKLIDELQTRPKRYIGEITLGFATETEDLDGAVIARKTIDTPIATTTIDAAIKVLNGAIKQIPPMYSAVKVNGRRLYDYARAGEIVMRPERDAMIYDFHRTSDVNFENNVQKFNFEATVSKGTYIRTLASDTGKALDIPATMTSLTRTMGSGFTLIQAHDLTEVEKLAPDDLLQIIVPIKDILTWPTHILSDDEWFAVKNGQKIAHWEPSTNFKQLYYNDKLKAVYQYDNSEQVWRSRYVFDNQ